MCKNPETFSNLLEKGKTISSNTPHFWENFQTWFSSIEIWKNLWDALEANKVDINKQ